MSASRVPRRIWVVWNPRRREDDFLRQISFSSRKAALDYVNDHLDCLFAGPYVLVEGEA